MIGPLKIICTPGTHCHTVYAPDNSLGLELESQVTGNLAVGSVLEFRCRGGMRFEDDFQRQVVTATCNGGDNYTLSADWGRCVDCKFV